MKFDWGFLDQLNTTAFKGWSVVWLWIATFAVWATCAIVSAFTAKVPPVEWLVSWLTALTAYSGVTAVQFKAMRDTDYGAIERKAGVGAFAPAPPKETP